MTIYLYYTQFGQHVSVDFYFFKVSPGCTFPCNVPIVNIETYVRMIGTMATENVYLYRALPYTTGQYFQQFYFQYISCLLSSIGFDLVILLGILNILIILFQYYLCLVLVEGSKYCPFCFVCKKMSSLFCLHLVTVNLK